MTPDTLPQLTSYVDNWVFRDDGNETVGRFPS